MAIPTQFSVAKKRQSPVANPMQPIDKANNINAESVGFISGASNIPAKDSVDISTPVTVTTVAPSATELPSLFGSLSAPAVDDAVAITPKAAASADGASLINAESMPAIAPPSFSIVDRIQWDFGGSDSGWTAVNASLTTGATSITAEMTGADFQLVREGLTGGARSEHVLWVQIRCTTATTNAAFTVFTTNDKHGYETAYSTSVPVNYEQGAYQNVYVNLKNIDGYAEDGLTKIRIDPFEGSLQTFEIERIWLGSYETDIAPKDAPDIEMPSIVAAESVPSISTPTTLTASAGTQTSGTFPLNHARILYDNLLFGYSAISSSEGTPINALTPHTGDRWYFDSSATTSAILITLQDAVDMDTICICAHNIGSIVGAVSLTYSSDGVAFVDWTPDFSPGTDAAIMQHVSAPRQVKAIRVQINSGAEATGFIGYISAGLALQMQRPFFNGHQPYTDSDVTEYYNAKSEAGNILNRDVRRKGFETSYEWSNIDDGWYRTYIPDLKEKAKKQPMVLAWNLLEYPDDVAFGMTTADIKAPMQNGTVTKRGGFGFTLVGV